MIYVVNINDKIYEVDVEKGKANVIKTTEAEALVPNTEIVKVENPVPATSLPSNNAAGERVKSPMPGSILDIKVELGARVKKGQVLLILEAMKMENEIFAALDGIVAQIMVSKGTNVATNDILMVIQ